MKTQRNMFSRLLPENHKKLNILRENLVNTDLRVLFYFLQGNKAAWIRKNFAEYTEISKKTSKFN